MTENTHPFSSGRRGQSNGLAWKSGLIASSMGAVLLGWALLAHADTAPATVNTPPEATQPRLIVVQIPVAVAGSSRSQRFVEQKVAPSRAQGTPSINPRIGLPTPPQKPIFQRPITRTRGS